MTIHIIDKAKNNISYTDPILFYIKKYGKIIGVKKYSKYYRKIQGILDSGITIEEEHFKILFYKNTARQVRERNFKQLQEQLYDYLQADKYKK